MFNALKVRVWLLSFVLLMPLTAGLLATQPASAETGPDSLTLSTDFPSVRDAIGGSFSFTVNIRYVGTEPKLFELTADAPAGSRYQILNGASVEITAIRLDPTIFSSNFVTVTFNPNSKGAAEPGEYPITVHAKSGELSDAITFTAVVTAKYGLKVTPQSGRFSANITAGRENRIPMILDNQSSVNLDNITLTMAAPDGWGVKFVPDKVASIPANSQMNIEAVVTPPKNTIAGDYDINGTADQKNANDFQKIRVTVQTPTLWGWLGILIVVAVIGGLGVIFRQLGRR